MKNFTFFSEKNKSWMLKVLLVVVGMVWGVGVIGQTLYSEDFSNDWKVGAITYGGISPAQPADGNWSWVSVGSPDNDGGSAGSWDEMSFIDGAAAMSSSGSTSSTLAFRWNDVNNGSTSNRVDWYSKSITGAYSRITASLDYAIGNGSSSNSVWAYYQIDGGAWTLFGSSVNQSTATGTFTSSTLSCSSSIRIKVEALTRDANAAFVTIDNVLITGCTSTYSGVYEVGATGTWATLTDAIADLKICMTDDVTLELQSTYDPSGETFPINFTGLPTSSTATLTVRPKTGVTETITSSNATGTILLDGADYIYFNGSPGGANTMSNANNLTISNTSTTGYVFKFINDATYNKIEYCNIRGVNTSASNGSIWFSTGAASGTGNEYNQINYCEIYDGASNPTNAIYSLGDATVNNNITINGNYIYNFFHATTAHSGILLSDYNTDWTITNNRFYQTAARDITNASAIHRVINVTHSTSAGNNFTITGNVIGGSASDNSGSYDFTGQISASSSGNFSGIFLNVGTTTASTVSSNTIKNLVLKDIYATSSAGFEGAFNGIAVLAGKVNIGSSGNGNTIGSISEADNITYYSGSSTTKIYGIYINSTSVVTASYNNIGGFSTSSTSGNTIAYQLVGIYNYSTGTITISNNTIGSTSLANSFVCGKTSSTGANLLYGIYNNGAATISFTDNTIQNLTNYTTSGSAVLYGIYNNAGATTTSFTSNTISTLKMMYDNSTSGSATTAITCGIYNNSSVATSITSNTITTFTIKNGLFKGLHLASTATHTVNSNTITDITVTTAEATTIHGIYNNGASNAGIYNMKSNIITNLVSSATSAHATVISGIWFNGQNATSTVEKNKMTGFSCTQTSTPIIYGIYNATSSSVRVYNNLFICNNGGNTNNCKIFGVYDGGATVITLYYNTFAISGSSNSGTDNPSSACFYHNNATGSKVANMQNNIFQNKRTSSTDNRHYVYALADNDVFSGTCNNNYYHASDDNYFAYILNGSGTSSGASTSANLNSNTSCFGGTSSKYYSSGAGNNSSDITINTDGSLSSAHLTVVSTGADLDAISGCESDIYYVARNASGGYKGCYESPCLVVSTNPTAGTICVGGTYSPQIIVTNATTISTTFTYQMQFATDNATFANVVNSTPANSSYTNGLTTSSSVATLQNAAPHSASVSGSIASGSAYYYRYMITSSAGCSIYTNNAQLTINAQPTIDTQPTAGNICVGGSYSPSIAASGGTSLTYQWQYSSDNSTWGSVVNGTPTNSSYLNATSNNLSQTGNITAGSNYYYRCVVSDAGSGCNSVTSNSVQLVINADPSITVQPTAGNICYGGTYSPSVTATGGTSLTYQWEFSTDDATWGNVADGTPLNATFTNGTTAALTQTGNIAAGSAYYYRCVINDAGSGCGSVNSNSVQLTINAVSVAGTAASNQTIVTGNTANLTLSAYTGTIQWQESADGSTGWASVSGGSGSTTDAYTTSTLSSTNYYRALVTSGVCSSVTSNTVTVTVTLANATITLASNTISAASSCASSTKVPIQSFTLAVTNGDGNLTNVGFTTTGTYAQADISKYQLWYGTSSSIGSATQLGTDLSSSGNAGARTFTAFTSPTLSNNTTYYFWITVDVAATPTNNVTLAVNAISTSNLTSTSTKAGSDTDAGGTQTLKTLPNITTHPSAATICVGGTYSPTVVASGGVTLSYQWQFSTNGSTGWASVADGTPTNSTFTNATTTTLSQTGNIAAGSAYYYRCVVSSTGNGCSNVNSNAAQLTINAVPTISVQPSAGTICVGGTYSPSVTATGGTSLTYQWQYATSNGGSYANVANSTPANATYTNGTTATLTVAGSIAAGSGNYYKCIVSDAGSGCSSVTSNEVQLTINAVPSISVQPSAGTICVGGTYSPSVTATGGTSLTYQWQYATSNGGSYANVANSTPANATYTNGTTATLTVAGSIAAGSGNYYKCVVSDAGSGCSSVTSNEVQLTINAVPAISVQPSDVTITEGGTYSPSITATGGVSLSYQWQYATTSGGVYSSVANNTPTNASYASATTNNMTMTGSVSAGTYYYKCYVTSTGSGCSAVLSNVSILTINTGVTTFYFSGSGVLSDKTNWGSNTNGTGTNPTNLTGNNLTFYVTHNTTNTPSTDASWTLGSGSKIIVGDGTNATNFNVGHTISGGTIDVSDNATLTISADTPPTLGTLANTSTVVFNGGALQNITIASGKTFGKLTLNNSNGATLTDNATIENTLTLTSGKLIVPASGTLNLGTTSTNLTMSGGSGSSYIVTTNNTSTIKRYINSNTSYVFPIGDASYYTPITYTLNSNTGLSSDYINVYVVDGVTPGFVTSNFSAYITRYWSVSPSSSARLSNYTVAYTYDNSDIVGTESTIIPVKVSGTTWYKPSNAVNITNGTPDGTGSIDIASNTLTWSNLTTYSFDTGAGDEAAALPIHLLYFTAKPEAKKVRLDWATASETNNDYFTVERSQDGEHFNELFKKPGAGISTTNLYYFGYDNKPLPGTSYYRLKQTDYDGKFAYSDVESVSLYGSDRENTIELKIYPNPAENGKFNVNFDAKQSEKYSISIYDAVGKLIYHQDYQAEKGINDYTIELPDLASGMYQLEVRNDNVGVITKSIEF